MADLERLQRALVAADAAGDADSARQFASAIKAARSEAPVAPQAPAPRSWGDVPLEAVKNIPSSAANFATGVYDMARHPIDTAGNIADVAAGGLRAITPKAVSDFIDKADNPENTQRIERKASDMGAALAGRYGGEEELKNTLATDPVGAAADAASVLGGGAGLARRVGMMPMKAAKLAAPTAEELAQATTAGYDKMRNSGVSITSDAMRQFVDDLKQKLAKDAHSAATDPRTFTKLDEIASGPAGSTVDIGFLDKFRSKLGEIAGGDEARPATLAIKELDRFLDNLNPQSVRTTAQGQALAVPGSNAPTGALSAQDAIDALKEARGNAAAGFRSDSITGLGESAERRAAAANSGQNIGNTIRQRLASLLDKHNGTRGFSPEELAATDQIATGTRGTNTARYLGNLMGGGGGLGQAAIIGAGAALGSPAGPLGAAVGAAALPAAGAFARSTANRMTRSQLRDLDELIRKRSPLYQQRMSQAPMQPVISDRSAALAQLLAAQNLNQE